MEAPVRAEVGRSVRSLCKGSRQCGNRAGSGPQGAHGGWLRGKRLVECRASDGSGESLLCRGTGVRPGPR